MMIHQYAIRKLPKDLTQGTSLYLYVVSEHLVIRSLDDLSLRQEFYYS